MDTDLEGLAGEDRQMRREGKKDKMSHTMSEYKSGARKQAVEQNQNCRGPKQAPCRTRRMDAAGLVEITESFLTMKFIWTM